MFALILESIGGTELLFILAIALIFFGPRKLPQLARSMGKGLSEFRKASDDFKRTWEREVALEAAKLNFDDEQTIQPSEQLPDGEEPITVNEPQIEPADPNLVVARSPQTPPETPTETVPVPDEATQPEPLRKHEWV